jgi:hypothetical protein
MTVEDVRARLEAIRAVADDDEQAHGLQDSLLLDVLLAIRNGADEPAALASAAVEVYDIDFERWCA